MVMIVGDSRLWVEDRPGDEHGAVFMRRIDASEGHEVGVGSVEKTGGKARVGGDTILL